MIRRSLLAPLAIALLAAGCQARGIERTAAPAPDPSAGSEAVGKYRLSGAEALSSGEGDSLFRFSDGTAAYLTVFRYAVPEEVKVGPDSQAWTAREGAKFEAIQPILVQQGRIETYRTAFNNTREVDLDGVRVLESAIAIGVRANGNVRMDFQYLYLVHGRFLKVRGTFPGQTWQTSDIANFSREIARRAQRAPR
jgi:hypothetical protein